MSDDFRFVPFHQFEPGRRPRPLVSLGRQIAAFERHSELALDLLAGELADERFRREVLRLASERLIEGYEAYGDAACFWEPATLRRNMLEEVADYVVYACIGGIGREGARG